jgi:phospholipase DDHD1
MISLTTKLNRLYKLFCEHNPYFEGKNGRVSLIAHSLGSVVVHDVLTSNTNYFSSQIQVFI